MNPSETISEFAMQHFHLTPAIYHFGNLEPFVYFGTKAILHIAFFPLSICKIVIIFRDPYVVATFIFVFGLPFLFNFHLFGEGGLGRFHLNFRSVPNCPKVMETTL